MHEFDQKKREIRDRVDIVDLVSEHVTLKRRGGGWVGLCPFHSEKTPSFTVRPEHGTFKCFGCGKGGDVFSFVQFRENVPFVEAMRILADRAGVELARSSAGESVGAGRSELAKVNTWALEFFRSQLLDESVGATARSYVQSRKISDETAARFGLGLAIADPIRLSQAAARAGIDTKLLLAADLLRANDEGRTYDTFQNRLIFPIRDATSRVVGFGGRTLVDHRAKYLNTRQNALFDKGRGLYGIDLAREAATERGRAVLVEGYTDCLAAHQAGFRETVATLGTALTESQVDLLRRYCDEIILLFDSDQAGEAAAERAIRVALPRCVKVRLARIPEGKDPSDYLSSAGGEAFSDVLKGAVDALEFRWLRTQERFGANASDAQRGEAVRDFLRLVAQACDSRAVDTIQQGLLVNQVAHLLRMDRSEVAGLVRRLRSRRSISHDPTKGGGSEEPGRLRVRDVEQANWTRVLEVLVTKPELIATVEELPGFSRIADERDRRIAAVVMGSANRGGVAGCADVLACLNDPADVQRAIDLAHQGEQRGNLESTLRLAVERIHGALRSEAVEQSKQWFVAAPDSDEASETSRQKLADLSQGVREHHSFSPRRLIRQAAQGSSLTPDGNEGSTSERHHD